MTEDRLEYPLETAGLYLIVLCCGSDRFPLITAYGVTPEDALAHVDVPIKSGQVLEATHEALADPYEWVMALDNESVLCPPW